MTDQLQPRSVTRRVLRRVLRIVALFVLVVAPLLLVSSCMFIRMPGNSHEGELPALTEAQSTLADELRGHVTVLAGDLGPRNVSHPEALAAAEAYLHDQLAAAGYDVKRQTYTADGVACSNLIVELPGTTLPDEIIIVGGHYDSAHFAPGADDNASAAAAVVALAKMFRDAQPARTIRFVCFVNEEPPYFTTELMGSLVYARDCQSRGDNIIAMICLEMLGYYSDEPGSQSYPLPGLGWIYPRTGNFITFVGNVSSRELTRQLTGSFRAQAQFPSEGAALPAWVPGVGWSDHWAFWKCGYPAVMVTDTAWCRNPHYHELTDLPETLDYDRMARVVEGLHAVVDTLADDDQ